MTPIPVLSRGLSAGTEATGSGVPGFLAAERRTQGFCCFLSLVVSPAPQGSRAAAFPLNVAPAPPPPRPGARVCHMPRPSGYWPSLRESVGGWEPGPQKPGMLSCLRGTLASGPCGRRTVTLLLGGAPGRARVKPLPWTRRAGQPGAGDKASCWPPGHIGVLAPLYLPAALLYSDGGAPRHYRPLPFAPREGPAPPFSTSGRCWRLPGLEGPWPGGTEGPRTWTSPVWTHRRRSRRAGRPRASPGASARFLLVSSGALPQAL